MTEYEHQSDSVFEDDSSPFSRKGSYEKHSMAVGEFSYGIQKIEIRSWGGTGTQLTIGKYCSIAANLKIFLGGNHRSDWITTYPFGYIYNIQFGGEPEIDTIYSNGDVYIGNDVWIGENVTIMSGIKIGNGAVIAAGAIVVKNVGNYEIVGGNPAKTIRYRFKRKIINLLEQLSWWDLPLEVISEIIPILQASPSSNEIKKLLRKYRD